MQLFEVCPRRCKYLPYNNPNHTTAGSASINPEERNKKERQVRRAKKRKRTKAQRAKPSTQSQAIDAHIGDEERIKERKTERYPNPATQDHTVASYDLRGSCGEPILLPVNPIPQGGG